MAGKESALYLLPELFSTGTLPPEFRAEEAEPIAHADSQVLADLARDLKAHVLAGSLAAEGGRLHNVALLFDASGALLGEYRKIHPFSLGGEDMLFASGEAAPVWDLEGLRLQPAVCYDLRFPELFRLGSESGANLIVLPANWPESRQSHWKILLRARAIENQAFAAGVNCVGTQRGTRYAGGSMLVSPKGEIIASLGEEEGTASGEVSPAAVDSWRRTFPALRDRKPGSFWKGLA
jgi:predicted amidohydrolase